MTPELYDALREALDYLPPCEPEPGPARRRLLIKTYAGETILASLRIENTENNALMFMGFDASNGNITVDDFGEFVFFDMENGALGILGKEGKVFGPVLTILPQVLGLPLKRPRRFTPLRLAAANGELVRPRRAPRTRRRT